MNMKKHWSERLREAMAEKAIHAADLAKKVGIKESSMSAWIAGRVNNPGASYIRKACMVLGVNFDWLMEGKGEKRRSVVAGMTPEQYAAGLEILADSEIEAMLSEHIASLPQEDRRRLYARLLHLVADDLAGREKE